MNASKAVSAVLSGLSLKSYCNRNKIGKTEYALVCETVKYINIIETLFRMCEMSSESLEVNKGMLFVYCYELLFGKGKIQGGGAVKRRLLEREQALRSSLAQHLRDCGASAHAELLDPHFTEHAQMPVYIRINTLKITSSDGFRILKGLYPDAVRDEHIPNLVVLPPGTKRAWDHECVRSGKFIVQVGYMISGLQIFIVTYLLFRTKPVVCLVKYWATCGVEGILLTLAQHQEIKHLI